ncbi:hypothetical protein DPMN_107542 [Dreissena polymorpha]|uniref:Uncharacterized protein n=1 Tax=Dreissena polymorpha TaxID=45954 RepID=A0A9D4K7C5_DREPO|nr:hypothetical protein DPMN_107542 [Dreissena polymorpha]
MRVPHATFKTDQEPGFEEEVERLYQACHSMTDINVVEQSTRGQASNKEWFVQRRGAITATKLFDVEEDKFPSMQRVNTKKHNNYKNLFPKPDNHYN